MTTKVMSAVIAVALILASCNNKKNATSALSDPQQQEALLDSIAGNPDLLQKVNDKAKAKGTKSGMNGMHNMDGMNMDSDTAMMGMMTNPVMMDQMMDRMMKQCEKDTAMCRRMCSKMMNSPKMKAMMKSMMNND